METTSQHISHATSTLEMNDPHKHKCPVTQSTHDQKKTSANTAKTTQIVQSNLAQAAPAQAFTPAESQYSLPVQDGQLNKAPQPIHTLPDTNLDKSQPLYTLPDTDPSTPQLSHTLPDNDQNTPHIDNPPTPVPTQPPGPPCPSHG